MNTYKITLSGYRPHDKYPNHMDLVYKKSFYIDAADPCAAQKYLLETQVHCGENDIVMNPIIGATHYEVEATNGVIFTTSKVMLVSLTPAY